MPQSVDHSVIQIPYANASQLDGTVLRKAEVVYDETLMRLRTGNGQTLGGIVSAARNYAEEITQPWTFDDVLTVKSDIMPFVPAFSNIGSLTHPFLSGHIAELHGTRFVEETIQVTGGYWFVPKQSSILTQDVVATTNQTVLHVKDGLYQVGDMLELRAIGKLEVMRVVTPAYGGDSYAVLVERDQDNSGANFWIVGDVVVNLGHRDSDSTHKDGWLELVGGNVPKISVWHWNQPAGTRSVWGEQSEIIRIGNLQGMADHGSQHRYGFFMGNWAEEYITWDQVNGLRIRGQLTVTGGNAAEMSDVLDKQTYLSAGQTTINGGTITTGTIYAQQLDADAINGKIITGATLRTAATGPRVEMNAAGIYGYTTGNVPHWYSDANSGILYAGGQGAWIAHNGFHMLYDGSNFDMSQVMWSNTVGAQYDETASLRVWDVYSNGRPVMCLSNMRDFLVNSYLGGTWTFADTVDVEFKGETRRLGAAGYLFVPLTIPMTAVAFTQWAYSTMGKTGVDMSAVFSDINNVTFPANVKAVLLKVAVRDSGSATNNDLWAMFSPNDTAYQGEAVRCGGLPNDTWVEGVLTVPCNFNGDLYFQCASSGAGTLDVTAQVWGYWV